jgi:hypothetical protein
MIRFSHSEVDERLPDDAPRRPQEKAQQAGAQRQEERC